VAEGGPTKGHFSRDGRTGILSYPKAAVRSTLMLTGLGLEEDTSPFTGLPSGVWLTCTRGVAAPIVTDFGVGRPSEGAEDWGSEASHNGLPGRGHPSGRMNHMRV